MGRKESEEREILDMLGKKKDRPALIIWLDKNVFSKEG